MEKVIVSLGIFFLFTSTKGIEIISVLNGAGNGNWGLLEACPQGAQAIGYHTQNDLVSLPVYDETALNSIRLFCSDGSNVTSTPGHTGTWELRQNCPEASALASFRLRVQPITADNSDNTAANSIQFTCTDGTVLNYNGNTGGEWSEYSNTCSQGICGLQTRVQPEGGTLTDNTSLNDVIFVCC